MLLKSYYGGKPHYMGNYPIKVDEMHFHLYMPIIMPEHPIDMASIYCKSILVEEIQRRLPKALFHVAKMIADSILAEKRDFDNQFTHWYITSKKMYVTPDNMANRPGWHSDAFGTDGVNFIWTDTNPTEFAFQDFIDISSDHNRSLEQFQEQVRVENIETYADNDLIRVDERHIHRVPVSDYMGIRHFIKISGSNNRFNLLGNTHNDRLDYNWLLFSRDELRNMESVDNNADYVI